MSDLVQDEALNDVITDLRVALATKTRYAFGALYVGSREGNSGFIFAVGMPQHARKELLDDMQMALDRAKKRFAI